MKVNSNDKFILGGVVMTGAATGFFLGQWLANSSSDRISALGICTLFILLFVLRDAIECDYRGQSVLGPIIILCILNYSSTVFVIYLIQDMILPHLGILNSEPIREWLPLLWVLFFYPYTKDLVIYRRRNY